MTAGSARETWVRDQFPALRSGEARMDGPAGSQVPVPVIRAMVRYLEADNANSGGLFSASVSTDSLIGRARDAMAGFLGCRPEEVGFGQNASTVNLLLSRAAVRSLRPGDEIVVTRLDHDSNIDPWLEGAKDVGAKVVMVDARDDTTLDMDGLAAAIGERTRVVAFPWACNATGTMTDVAQISAMAHAAGALSWVDATHFAPHGPIDVTAVEADVAICSPYKFFGPHLGVFYAKQGLLEGWLPLHVRASAPQSPAQLLEPGTLPGESLAGLVAAVEYIQSLGWPWIREQEARLGTAFLEGLPPAWELYGLGTMNGRTATFAIGARLKAPSEWAAALAADGIAVTAGHFRATRMMERLGLPAGAVRVGFLHYNTLEEVERVLAALGGLGAG